VFKVDLDFSAQLKHSVFGFWESGPREGMPEAILLDTLIARYEPADEQLTEVA